MKTGKMTVLLVLAAFLMSLTACAAVPVEKLNTGNIPAQFKTVNQIKLEQEEQTRAILVKGGSTFVGILIGGLVGLLTSPKANAVSSTIIGCAVGGAAGFGAGMVIYDKTSAGGPTADDNKVKEFFQDYRNIQLKD